MDSIEQSNRCTPLLTDRRRWVTATAP